MEYKEYLIRLSKPLIDCIESLDNIGTVTYQSSILPEILGLQTYVSREHLLLYDFIESVEDIDSNYGELLKY